MSISRFRHSTGHVAKPQCQFLNVSSSTAMWEGSNKITCNEKFVAVPWKTFGGCAVFSHVNVGKIAPNPPIVLGQEGPIIDVQFDPFDPQKLFTASEDGTIFGWSIPAEGLKENISDPVARLNGHNKKCGIITFHPSAKGVLGSAAVDRVINIWDVEKNTAVTTIHHLSDYATGLEWNLNGSLFCVTSRDKKLNILDSHDGAVVSSVETHSGARAQRCVWCKRKNTIMTFGWNDSQQRQIKLWDTRNMASAFNTTVLDQSSSSFMPVYDEDINLLFVGSRGVNNVKCFELMNDGLTFSFEVATTDPINGLCMVPKWCLDVKRCEFDRLYQLTYDSLLPIDMVLPRKQAGLEFQYDVFPPTFASHPALTANRFFNGEDAAPREYNLEALFDGNSPQLCAKTYNTTPSLPSQDTGNKHTTAADHNSEVSTVTQSKKNAVDGSSSESGDDTKPHESIATAKYVDPLSDMTQIEIKNKELRIKEISRKLLKCHQEIATLRKALAEKEAEMLVILEEFQDF